MRFRHPRIIGTLISVLFCFALLDACLYRVDPLGIVASVHGNHSFHAVMQGDSTGYILHAGTHRFHAYTATILADGSRVVPTTNTEADCTIAAIGDSMTFGQGVDDTDTWVNVLANQYPDVRFINAARPDYSAPNVAMLKQVYPADGYLWLLIGNDNLEAYQYTGAQPAHPYPMATALYRAWLVDRLRGKVSHSERDIDINTYWQAVADIQGMDTLIFGFVNDPLTMETALTFPVVLIPPFTAFVSPVDGHPNATGHQQIADSMKPYLTPFVEMVCDGKNR